MNEKVSLENLSLMQRGIYENFSRQYPLIEFSFRDTFLKYTHFSAQYQIMLDGSDNSLLDLLPEEPDLPTATQIAKKLYQDKTLEADAFKILLPFIIYELANPEPERLPQCNQPNYEKLNAFESIIARTRQCIVNQKAKNENVYLCKNLALMQFQLSVYDDTYDQIAKSAQVFLNITDFIDLNTAGEFANIVHFDQGWPDFINI